MKLITNRCASSGNQSCLVEIEVKIPNIICEWLMSWFRTFCWRHFFTLCNCQNNVAWSNL